MIMISFIQKKYTLQIMVTNKQQCPNLRMPVERYKKLIWLYNIYRKHIYIYYIFVYIKVLLDNNDFSSYIFVYK